MQELADGACRLHVKGQGDDNVDDQADGAEGSVHHQSRKQEDLRQGQNQVQQERNTLQLGACLEEERLHQRDDGDDDLGNADEAD